jgi:hypothetical protein
MTQKFVTLFSLFTLLVLSQLSALSTSLSPGNTIAQRERSLKQGGGAKVEKESPSDVAF